MDDNGLASQNGFSRFFHEISTQHFGGHQNVIPKHSWPQIPGGFPANG